MVDTNHATPTIDYTEETAPPIEHPATPAATPEELFMVDVRSELSAHTDALIRIERILDDVVKQSAEAAEIGTVFKQFGAAMDNTGPAGINILGKPS